MILSVEDYMISCPTKKFLGVECFGCGTQRALVLIFQGKFIEAFHMFPAIYPMLIFLMFIILNYIDKKRNYSNFLIASAVITCCTMVISYFIKHPLH